MPEQEEIYIPRLTADGIRGNPYWYSRNPFYNAGYGMPNCTAYAWGRFWENSDINHDFSMLMDEIDKALTLPNNFDEIITPFINKNVDIQNNKYSKQQSLYWSNN